MTDHNIVSVPEGAGSQQEPGGSESAPANTTRPHLSIERRARARVEALLREDQEGLGQEKSAATARSQFYASMGHTLRTPLNAMKGFAGILIEEACGPLNDRQRDFVERIIEAGDRQLEIINNLTYVAKLDSGQICPENSQVSIPQVVRDSFDQFRSRGEEKGLSMDMQCGANIGVVAGDAVLLTTAASNLLSNAVRLTESGGTVCIKATAHIPDGDAAGGPQSTGMEEVRIEVGDTGPGISSEDLQFIFDDFERAGAVAARRLKSRGSGLALARRIVELHGGRIWAESDGLKGQGSRFFFVLPVQTVRRAVA